MIIRGDLLSLKSNVVHCSANKSAHCTEGPINLKTRF